MGDILFFSWKVYFCLVRTDSFCLHAFQSLTMYNNKEMPWVTIVTTSSISWCIWAVIHKDPALYYVAVRRVVGSWVGGELHSQHFALYEQTWGITLRQLFKCPNTSHPHPLSKKTGDSNTITDNSQQHTNANSLFNV